jgi:transposase
MKRFVEGVDRTQVSLLPECVEDYVAEDNPVRVIEAFVEQLDLGAMGFEGIDPEATGRPAYHPSVLLKIYIYGYLNRVQSSRRLEHETQRNIELMWLTGRLMPDFKTIANFRKDNGKSIRRVCRQFIVLCRELNLFSQALVAIDGSKFKAVNNRDKNFTAAKMKRRLATINESIERYLRAMDTADRAEPEVAALKKGRLQDKIEALKQQMQQLKAIEAQMNASPDKQVSLTDPDARSMKNREGGIVGYNMQTAVDAEHHLIVSHEVINQGLDCDQLSTMAEELTVVRRTISAAVSRCSRPATAGNSCAINSLLATAAYEMANMLAAKSLHPATKPANSPNPRRTNTYGPPASGTDVASSA